MGLQPENDCVCACLDACEAAQRVGYDDDDGDVNDDKHMNLLYRGFGFWTCIRL